MGALGLYADLLCFALTVEKVLEDGLCADMYPCLFVETLSVHLDGQVVGMTTSFDKSIFIVVETDKCDEEEEECDGDDDGDDGEEECDGDDDGNGGEEECNGDDDGDDGEEEEDDTDGDQKRWKLEQFDL